MHDPSIALFEQRQGVLACPLCGSGFAVLHEGCWILRCDNRHTFNIAREGFVNLLTTHRKKPSGYGGPELVARKAMLQNGLFEPLVEHLTNKTSDYASHRNAEILRIADFGTGEGTVFSVVIANLVRAFAGVEGYGTDISPAGIKMGSKIRETDNILWMVANSVRNLPFQDHTLDVVLCVLAPLSAEEVARVVRTPGLVILVQPGERHFVEFRDAVFEQEREQRGHEEQVLAPFRDLFRHEDATRTTYTVDVPPESLDNLIHMTPLFWKASRTKLDILRETGLPRITLDFVTHCFAV